ncbi:DUF1330 domain-containing protein [Halovulum sp. GXIMD14794]
MTLPGHAQSPSRCQCNGPVLRGEGQHGGKYLARTATHEQLERVETNAALRIVIEWPSRDAAVAFMNDPDYVPHLKAHAAGSESFHFLIEGKDDLA